MVMEGPMVTKKYILVLDVGTTNIKAILFDRDGTMVEEAFEKIRYIIKEDGQVEQDPTEIWNLSKKALGAIFKKGKLQASDISAIGISTQRSSFCIWDKKTGKPKSNIITWQDKRAADYAKTKTNSFKLATVRGIAKIARRVVRTAQFNMLSILKFDTVHSSVRTGYLFEQHPKLKSEAFAPNSSIAWGTIDSWLIWNLTEGKVHATDYSCASSTGILDPFSLVWNKTVLDLFGIPKQILPEIKDTVSDFGTTKLFGKGEIRIGAVVADQQASLFGQCCFGYGDLKCTNGTGSFVDINTGEKPFVSLRRLYPLVAWRIAGKTNYMLEGQSQNAGNIVDWLIRSLSLIDEPEETEKLAMSVSSTNGVTFVPAFTTGLTFPYWDPSVQGNVFGISLDTSKAHIVRAVLEGICFRIRDIVDGIIKDTGIKVSRIKLDGGVSKNRFIRQFLADILGIPVDYTGHPEPTALGASFLAGLSTGYYKSIKELGTCIRVTDKCVPKIPEDVREKKYADWKVAIEKSLRSVKKPN
jgi:glycerol kinase